MNMEIRIKNLKFVTTNVVTELDKYADKEQLIDLVRRALLEKSMVGDITVK